MNYVDVLLIIIMLVGVYLGWNAGFIKSIIDLVAFYISSIIAYITTSLLINYLYPALPFLNLAGKCEGIKAINIIVWRVIIYIFIMIILLLIISSIFRKTGLKQRLLDTMVDTNIILRIFGVLFFFPITAIFLLHAILFFNLPIFNMQAINESVMANVIMTEIPVISSLNYNIYVSENYAIEEINGDNSVDTYTEINESILDNLVSKNIISSDAVESVSDKLEGIKGQTSDDDDNDDTDVNDNKNAKSVKSDDSKLGTVTTKASSNTDNDSSESVNTSDPVSEYLKMPKYKTGYNDGMAKGKDDVKKLKSSDENPFKYYDEDYCEKYSSKKDTNDYNNEYYGCLDGYDKGYSDGL